MAPSLGRDAREGDSVTPGLEASEIETNRHEQTLIQNRGRRGQIPLLIAQKEGEKRVLAGRKATLEARKKAAEVSLARAELDLTRTILRAPAGGAVLEWFRSSRIAWPGRVDRLRCEIDDVTRMLTAIVVVEDSGDEFAPERSMPLRPGMFCRVEVPGYVHKSAIVIPRTAIRPGNRVHLITDGRLEIREIVPLRVAGEEVVVKSGLASGDVLVLSDLPAAVPGERLRPEWREKGDDGGSTQ